MRGFGSLRMALVLKPLNGAGIGPFAFDFRGYRNSDLPEEASLALGGPVD
jgi:hypothetical protein